MFRRSSVTMRRRAFSAWSAPSGRSFAAAMVKASSLSPSMRHTHKGYCYAPVDFLDFPLVNCSREPVRARAGDKFLGLDLSAHVLPKYRQQLRAWRQHGTTVHLIVYDLLPLLKPGWFTSTASAHFRNWFNVLAEDADQAICISKQVSRDLRDRLRERSPGSALSIVNMKMGGDIANSRPSEGICQEVSDLLDRLRFRPAILMVGTIEPRKAYDTALAAFEHLWRDPGGEAPDLVIVGKPGWKTLALQQRLRAHPEHGSRLHWLDQVTDEGLCRLYESCRGCFDGVVRGRFRSAARGSDDAGTTCACPRSTGLPGTESTERSLF